MEILKTENLKKYYGKGVNRVKALEDVYKRQVRECFPFWKKPLR